jgi:hypothetical protein
MNDAIDKTARSGTRPRRMLHEPGHLCRFPPVACAAVPVSSGVYDGCWLTHSTSQLSKWNWEGLENRRQTTFPTGQAPQPIVEAAPNFPYFGIDFYVKIARLGVWICYTGLLFFFLRVILEFCYTPGQRQLNDAGGMCTVAAPASEVRTAKTVSILVVLQFAPPSSG